MSGKAAQTASKTPKDDGGSGEAWKPSELLMMVLGDHAEQQGLKQDEGESEIEFAVRCIEKLGDLLDQASGSIANLESQVDGVRQLGVLVLSSADPQADLAPLDATEPPYEHGVRLLNDAAEKAKGLRRSLTAQKGAATKARGTIKEMEEAAKPRALGPVEPLEEDGAKNVKALFDLVNEADQVVLAFSNGREELRGIAPREVGADDFRIKQGRLLFTRSDLVVTGPGGDDAAAPKLAGVALLLDGEQVAWSPMAKAVDLGAGQSMSLTGSVIFG